MESNTNPQYINKRKNLNKHEKNNQKYLNDIYQTIKQQQYYIHRSITPNLQISNNNDLSTNSQRSEKIRKNQNLQPLPKLNIKDLTSNQFLQITLSHQNKIKKTIDGVLKKQNISSRNHIGQQKVNLQTGNKKIYQFGNFPQSKVSNYSPFLLKQCRQLRDKRIQFKQKKYNYSQQPFVNNNHQSQSFRNKVTKTSKSQLKKINKDNMNMLGLNVQKVSYSEKKDPKKCQNFKLSKNQIQNFAQKAQRAQIKNKSNLKELLDQQFDEKNHQDKDFIDLDMCQILINQKMQINKKYIMQAQFSKNSPIFSPSRIRKRINSSDKKNMATGTLNVQQLNPVYQTRYKKYLDFILKVSYSYKIYGQMDEEINANMHAAIKNDKKYKAWIGNGNNGNLLKALIKRRFWWQIVQQKSFSVNFIWTQLKNNQYFKIQQKSLKNKQKNQTIQSETLKCNLSTCLSSNGNQKVETKSTSYRSSRAHSSLIASVAERKKISSSPTKKMRNPIYEQQNQNFHKIMNNEQKLQYIKLSHRLQNKTFDEKLQLLNIKKFNPFECHVHNHLMNNFYLGNKKALFYNLKQYYELKGQDLFKTVPLTFHIKKGTKDPAYKKFLAYYKKRQMIIKKQQKQMQKYDCEQKRKTRNIWIVKPGQLTNRGNGITVIDQIYQFNSILKSQGTHNDGSQKTFIVQLYIDRPLLYKKRKFDIRHYMLITHINGIMKGYWFEQGYIRTSGYQFDIQEFQRQIHLTNDAVQKYTPNYGRFQAGNKLSYAQFQKYLDSTYPKKNYSFYNQILPRMKQICLDSIKSSFLKLSPEKLQHNFQLFGMDFMIDSQFVPWLIEINTNPCLQITCALQARLLPQVLDQTLRLTLDVIYPPPCHYPNTYRHLVPQASLQNMKYEVIFDQRIHGDQIKKIYQKNKKSNILEDIGQLQDDEVYENQGQLIKLDQLLQ